MLVRAAARSRHVLASCRCLLCGSEELDLISGKPWAAAEQGSLAEWSAALSVSACIADLRGMGEEN